MWKQPLGKSNDPYMKRWGIETKRFSVRLHHWFRGDDDRHYHDHSWNFMCIVLKGSYEDISYSIVNDITTVTHDRLTAGSVRYRPADFKHIVKTDGCWSLVLTGPEIRKFGFWVPNKSGKMVWLRARRYFFKYGHQ